MLDLNSEIPADIRDCIRDRLDAVEAEDGVDVLFAVESGSRAWGFASPDSDYDVRFVYRHPRDWYLSLKERRDVIERDIDAREIDLAGWDIRKALRLLLKWNPALFEWLVSPITYRQSGDCRAAMRSLYEEHADLQAIGHHYLSLARTQWGRMDTGPQVKLKKYFYVLRPLMALHWLTSNHAIPPMNFDLLREARPWPAEINSAVDDFITLKRATPELGTGARIDALDLWVEATLAAADPSSLPASKDPNAAQQAADDLFREMILEN